MTTQPSPRPAEHGPVAVYMLLTDQGASLALCSHTAIDGPEARADLEAQGFGRLLAYPLDLQHVLEAYPSAGSRLLAELEQKPAVKVLDDDAARVFSAFSFRALRHPVRIAVGR